MTDTSGFDFFERLIDEPGEIHVGPPPTVPPPLPPEPGTLEFEVAAAMLFAGAEVSVPEMRKLAAAASNAASRWFARQAQTGQAVDPTFKTEL